MFEPARVLSLDATQRQRLEFLVRAGSTPQKLVQRARIILLAAAGRPNAAIARELDVSRPTVLLWRERFARGGVPGLSYERPRPGRKPAIGPERIQAVVEATLQTTPPAATQWSVRTMTKAQGLGRTTIHRIWKAHGLQPHRVETFKLSRDKRFVEKLRDVVGLYLNPPEHALVLSIDEKSQIQALDRTQPGLPLKKGRAGTMTHDYKRNGTTTLFAALNTLNGKVIATCMPQHRHQEWLKFLRLIDKSTPRRKQLHLIIDNYSPHKHPAVQAWLEQHPRFHIHFTPTSASWLNMVERFFRDITQKQIRRGCFANVA